MPERTAFISVFVLATMLGACSTVPYDSPGLTEKAEGQQMQLVEQRNRQVNSVSYWEFNARFSFITESEAWSGKLFWQQNPDSEYLIHFSDPAGQGAMQLAGNPEQVELVLANGDRYQAKDADTLLRQETDWELPISSLWYWIRGLPDPGLALQAGFNGEGLPARFDQDGWMVDYQSYHHIDNHSFPRKITIKKGELRLKLIVMNWMFE